MKYLSVCSGIEAVGNSMAVPVMKFIGERLQFLENELDKYRRGVV